MIYVIFRYEEEPRFDLQFVFENLSGYSDYKLFDGGSILDKNHFKNVGINLEVENVIVVAYTKSSLEFLKNNFEICSALLLYFTDSDVDDIEDVGDFGSIGLSEIKKMFDFVFEIDTLRNFCEYTLNTVFL